MGRSPARKIKDGGGQDEMIKDKKPGGQRRLVSLPAGNFGLELFQNPSPSVLQGNIKAHRNAKEPKNRTRRDRFTTNIKDRGRDRIR